MVKIKKIVKPPFDFAYIFSFDYPIDLEKAHDELKKIFYVRWVSLKIPPLPRAEHPEAWQVWIGQRPYPYPEVILIRNVEEKGEIEFRGYLPYPVPADYLYRLAQTYFKPLLDLELISVGDYRDILEFFKPIVKILVISIRGFDFQLTSDWGYKIRVSTPSTWIKDWQTDMFGKAYSVKHRSIMLLQTLGIASNYFAGYKFVPLTEEAIEKRKKAGKILTVWRTMQFDPDGNITVEETEPDFWLVDFSKFSKVLPEKLDLEAIKSLAEEKGYPTKIY